MPSMIWSKVTTIAYEDDWFFISGQMGPADDCQDFNSQELELIFSTVSVVNFAV